MKNVKKDLDDDLKIEKKEMRNSLRGSLPPQVEASCPDDCSSWCVKDCKAGFILDISTGFNWAGGFWFG